MRHTESNLQRACVRWFRLQYPHLAPLLFAVPNGGFRNAREAAILKAEGVVPGVADLILLVPRGGHGALCLELKSKEGSQRPTQRAWQQATQGAGNRYRVVRDVEGFIREVEEYLSLDSFVEKKVSTTEL